MLSLYSLVVTVSGKSENFRDIGIDTDALISDFLAKAAIERLGLIGGEDEGTDRLGMKYATVIVFKLFHKDTISYIFLKPYIVGVRRPSSLFLPHDVFE